MLGMRNFVSTCYRPQVNLSPTSIGQKRAVSALNHSIVNEHIKCEKVAREAFETELPIESFEEYKKSPFVQGLCGNDEKRLRRAYEGYVQIMETERVIAKNGGNPAHMI